MRKNSTFNAFRDYTERTLTQSNCANVVIGEGIVALATMRKVKANEELFHSYGPGYWCECDELAQRFMPRIWSMKNFVKMAESLTNGKKSTTDAVEVKYRALYDNVEQLTQRMKSDQRTHKNKKK